jgi:hypothetical protein
MTSTTPLTDLDSELPIAEMTVQAHKHEKNVGLSMVQHLHRNFSLPLEVVAGDANYDVEEMGGEAMIPRNPRNMHHSAYTLIKDGVYC